MKMFISSSGAMVACKTPNLEVAGSSPALGNFWRTDYSNTFSAVIASKSKIVYVNDANDSPELL